jgi:hypothetical protein
VKVDTGVAANTLPFRTYTQMFPEKLDGDGKPRSDLLEPAPKTLFAYNNMPIECY